jgi:anti-sigma B factor antagonist
VSPCGITLEHGDDGSRTLVVSGEVDVTCAPLLRERLLEVFSQGDLAGELVVDLRDASFIDSTGLGVLVGANKRATAAGSHMTVIASPAARHAMRLTGLDALWTVVDAPPEADPAS